MLRNHMTKFGCNVSVHVALSHIFGCLVARIVHSEVLFRFVVFCVFVVHVVRSVILAHAVGGIVLINSLSCLITYSRWCYLDIFICIVLVCIHG